MIYPGQQRNPPASRTDASPSSERALQSAPTPVIRRWMAMQSDEDEGAPRQAIFQRLRFTEPFGALPGSRSPSDLHALLPTVTNSL